ncbi:COG3014 family protein [Leminorella richardii]|nr:hypothetical protein [Leminorella richardii]
MKNQITRVSLCCGIALALASCANPPSRQNLDYALSQGHIEMAEKIALDEGVSGSGEATHLLWSLEAGALLRMTNQLDRSTKVFDGAELLIKDSETKNIAASGLSQAASMVVNDNVMDYSPRVYDRVMVNTYKALNFWQLADFNNARVEWNRVDDRQRRAAEYFSKEINEQKSAIKSNNLGESYSKSMETLEGSGIDVAQWKPYDGYINPASLYLHGLYFLINNENVGDLNKAKESLKRAYALTKNRQIRSDLNLANSKGRNVPPGVWVIFENGSSARKAERRIDLPLLLVTRKVAYAGIALPTLESGSPAYPYLSINGGNKTESFAQMDKIIQGEFKTEFTGILIKELSRAILKTAAQATMMNSDNKTIRILGAITGVAQAVTTQADIRSWHTLPYDFQVAYVKWPSSQKIQIAPSGGSAITVDLPATPQPVVVYVRSINSLMPPKVDVLTSKNAM